MADWNQEYIPTLRETVVGFLIIIGILAAFAILAWAHGGSS